MWKKKPMHSMLILFFTLALPAFAQETMSLQQLVQLALEENYQVQIRENREQIAQNNNTPGNAGFFPTVDLSGEQSLRIENSQRDYYMGETRTGSNARSTSLNAMVELNWLVFDGLKMFARKDRLERLQRMGKLETRYFLEETVADLATAYFRLLRERKLLEAYEQSMHISAFRMGIEKRKKEVGASGALAYNQALVDYYEDSSRVSNQDMQMRNLETTINEIINRKLSARLFPAKDTLKPRGINEKQALVDSALNANSQLKQARVEELIADAEHRREKGDRFPEVGLFGQYRFSQQTSESGFVEKAQSSGPALGVRLRFRLFNGGREKVDIANARVRKRNAQLQQQDTRSMIRAAITRNVQSYHSLYTQYRITRQSLEAARNSLKIARNQLEQGAINGYDFRQTQQRLLQTRYRFIELQYQLKVLEIDLQRLSGDLLGEVM